jgi:hypothetical protein
VGVGLEGGEAVLGTEREGEKRRRGEGKDRYRPEAILS